MQHIKPLGSYTVINEAALTETDLTNNDITTIRNSKSSDFGDKDTPTRRAILKALEQAVNYFNEDGRTNMDLKSKLITLASDEEQRVKLYNLAKTFAVSAQKIQKIQIDEIEPVSTQIQQLLDI